MILRYVHCAYIVDFVKQNNVQLSYVMYTAAEVSIYTRNTFCILHNALLALPCPSLFTSSVCRQRLNDPRVGGQLRETHALHLHLHEKLADHILSTR